MTGPMTPEREADLRRFADSPQRLVWAEVDRLRDRISEVLDDGDHGLYCDSHYGQPPRPCTCWHAKVSKIVGYES